MTIELLEMLSSNLVQPFYAFWLGVKHRFWHARMVPLRVIRLRLTNSVMRLKNNRTIEARYD